MTLIFNRLLEVVKVLRNFIKQSAAVDDVIVFTEKKNSAENNTAVACASSNNGKHSAILNTVRRLLGSIAV